MQREREASQATDSIIEQPLLQLGVHENMVNSAFAIYHNSDNYSDAQEVWDSLEGTAQGPRKS